MTKEKQDQEPDELTQLRAEAEALGIAYADQYQLEELRLHVQSARLQARG
jgi:hypothetical protein